jgi:hypothetical protein
MTTVNLSSLVFQAGATIGQPMSIKPPIAVYNTGREGTGNQNGGACCCAPVPSGAGAVAIEIWGAGGDGPGACCCQGSYRSASQGAYAKTTFAIPAGVTYYNICAGGSGCCAQCCCGNCGFPSFVLNPSGSVVSCAQGGGGGCGVCGHMGGQACTGQCQSACSVGICNGCSSTLGCLVLMGSGQTEHESNFCTSTQWQWLPGATKYYPITFSGLDSCEVGMTAEGCCYFGNFYGMWPGGGGPSAQACGGGCCWGHWGIGGLVLVCYI